MDLQNVKNITIPEGSVKTIHDSQNRLLWGAVGYNTTYRGDTTQQTYSGKNLWGGFTNSYTRTNANVTFTYNTDGTALINGKSNQAAALSINNTLAASNNIYVTLQAGTYSISASNNFKIDCIDLSGTNLAYNYGSQPAPTFTISEPTSVFIRYRVNKDEEVNNETVYAQIEAGSSVTSYEPYVGGVLAPNPDYPQTVNVVTGVQTVTISDGNTSQSYTVDLGAIELCKIGNYQDYIYKSGDDWYVHKEIEKLVLDGSETWYQWEYSSAFITVLDSINPSSRTTGIVMSDRFIEGQSTTAASQWNNFPNGTVAIRQFTTYPKIGFKTNVANNLATWKTWLSTHNTTVYYVLATLTDTKITDNTLIGQLEVIHQWLIRYGYNSTVSGNLPIIIDRTNL